MLDLSIFKQKESHQSFGNIKDGWNQTTINIAQIQKFIFNLILQKSLIDSAEEYPNIDTIRDESSSGYLWSVGCLAIIWCFILQQVSAKSALVC